MVPNLEMMDDVFSMKIKKEGRKDFGNFSEDRETETEKFDKEGWTN